MKVTLNKGPVHSVEITGDFTGPYINLELSAQVAYELLQALEARRAELYDMVHNFYDCEDCGQTHPKSVKACPNTFSEDEDLPC